MFFLPLLQWLSLFLFFDSVKVDSGLRKWRANQVSDDRKAWIGAKKGIHSQSTYSCFLRLNSVTMGLYTGRSYNGKINICIEWWWLQYSPTYSRSFYPARKELEFGSHNLPPSINPNADTTIVMEQVNAAVDQHISDWTGFSYVKKKQPDKYWLIKVIITLLTSAINLWCKIHV